MRTLNPDERAKLLAMRTADKDQAAISVVTEAVIPKLHAAGAWGNPSAAITLAAYAAVMERVAAATWHRPARCDVCARKLRRQPFRVVVMQNHASPAPGLGFAVCPGCGGDDAIARHRVYEILFGSIKVDSIDFARGYGDGA